MSTHKQDIHDCWNTASCGENLFLSGSDRAPHEAHVRARYSLEPSILDITPFETATGQPFARWSEVDIPTVLGHGDLLESQAGQAHRGLLLSLGLLVWPRTLLKRFSRALGLVMMIEARK